MTYLADLIESTAATEGYIYDYGLQHWININDRPYDSDRANSQIYCFMLWQDEQYGLNGFSAIETVTEVGEFMLVIRSEINDQDYKYKYNNGIRRLKDEARKFCEALANCTGYDVLDYGVVEMENQLDSNFDGVKVRIKTKTNVS